MKVAACCLRVWINRFLPLPGGSSHTPVPEVLFQTLLLSIFRFRASRPARLGVRPTQIKVLPQDWAESKQMLVIIFIFLKLHENVTPDFVKAIKELKLGKIELRIDKDANLHLIVRSHGIFGKEMDSSIADFSFIL